MKNRLLLLVHIFFLASQLFSQNQTGPQIEWQRCYGGSKSDNPSCIQQTHDGGYILVGEVYSEDGDVSEIDNISQYWIVKIDSLGNISWEKTYGGYGGNYASSVLQLPDGGYVVVGWANSNGGVQSVNYGNTDYWVIKLDINGNLIWEKTYGGTEQDIPYVIKLTSEGNYIIAGFSFSKDIDITENHGGADCWLIEIDSTGNILWEKSYGGSMNEKVYSIALTDDGGYIMAGYSESKDGDVTNNQWNGNSDYWVIKLDFEGNIIWDKIFGGSKNDIAYGVVQTIDGGFIVTGSAFSHDGDVKGNHGWDDAWTIKLDASGNIVWQNSLGGSNDESMGADSNIQASQNGGCVTLYSSSSYNGNLTGNQGKFDTWLVSLDSLGNIIWQKSYGGKNYDEGRSMLQTADGGYIILSRTNSQGGVDGDITGSHGSYDYWVMKLKPFTPIPKTIEDEILVFPIPTYYKLTVKIKEEWIGLNYQIISQAGQEVLNGKLEEISTYLDLSSLARGIYYLKVGNLKTIKVIKK